MRKLRGLGPVIFLAVFAAVSAIVMLLWNSVMVNIFAVPAINFWYAAGLLILSKLLLGGWVRKGHGHFHGHFGHRGRCHDKWRSYAEGCKDTDWREMHDKFHSMNHRERREFIRSQMASGFHGHGFHGRPASDNGPQEDEAQTDRSENNG